MAAYPVVQPFQIACIGQYIRVESDAYHVTPLAKVLSGVLLILIGIPLIINHPLIDLFNRWTKSIGTTQSPVDIQMSEVSVLIGRVGGTAIAACGVILVLDTLI
ncbi:hypothetical protein C480_01465 [Natrialba aegyptia DSM 13077]|uniref:Uncharacterized protein n=1 Tax=Natrialba aegyptia DSM 13077 TaxID=1227491 RepID=M0BIR7_9EURY|nr:hypothetical protein C480_01465 [Natrialba aegyptia DSM 13077]